MELGIIGLGRMGINIARRLARAGHSMVVYNRSPEKALALADEEPDVVAVTSLEEFSTELATPRSIWIMVPSGDATEQMIDALLDILTPGDVIIDGGNSNYRDTMRRAAKVSALGLNFVDVGTSGGVWGLSEGYSMMVGGQNDIHTWQGPMTSPRPIAV